MMKAVRILAAWIVWFNTVDGPTETSVRRFVLSARLGLWPAITVSCLAFGHILDYGAVNSLALSLNLCLVASFAFLFNDVRDARIDAANQIHRWSIKSTADWKLFVVTVASGASIVAFSYLWLSFIAFAGTIAALLVSMAYSIICKRLLVVGNVVAAGLSLSPGLVIFFDSEPVVQANATVAGVFLLIAFSLLLSREIKFDEFDLKGDLVGKRLTVPMVVSGRVLNRIHTALLTGSIVALFAVIIVAGKYQLAVSLPIAAVTCGATIILLVRAYRGPSKEVFYKTTRLVMLVIPAAILTSF